jgi:hypothetical protein
MVQLRTTFRLSNKQRKALFVNKHELTIAIPVPPEIPDDFDPRRVIGLSMHEDHESCIYAEYRTLLVIPPQPPGEGQWPTKGTQGVIGRIVPSEEYAAVDIPVTSVECVVATFRPPGRIMGEPEPLKWPGRIFLDGRELNGETQTQ